MVEGNDNDNDVPYFIPLAPEWQQFFRTPSTMQIKIACYTKDITFVSFFGG